MQFNSNNNSKSLHLMRSKISSLNFSIILRNISQICTCLNSILSLLRMSNSLLAWRRFKEPLRKIGDSTSRCISLMKIYRISKRQLCKS